MSQVGYLFAKMLKTVHYYSMKKIFLFVGVVCLFFVNSPVLASGVVSNTHQLYTLTSIIEMLIQKGFISEDNKIKAYDFGSVYLEQKSKKTTKNDVKNADKIDISVSQYIEYGARTYNRFEDIKGLLLKVENTSDESIVLEAKRQCHVIYRIYSEQDELVYDSSAGDKCKVDETVFYSLDAGKSRLFEVTHRRSTKTLSKGKYRFEIEYPGYGKGERIITII